MVPVFQFGFSMGGGRRVNRQLAEEVLDGLDIIERTLTNLAFTHCAWRNVDMICPPGLAEPCPEIGDEDTTHAALVEAAMEADARKAAAQWAAVLEAAALETKGQVTAVEATLVEAVL